jgi:hypothetical protein
MSRYCPTCGALAPERGAFCIRCGSGLGQPEPTSETTSPVAARTSATAEMAGRSCPYCRFPLKEGGDVETCPSCKAVHHGDCWQENAGCAVNGCGAKAIATSEGPVGTAATTVLPSPGYAQPAASGQMPYSAPSQQAWPAVTPPASGPSGRGGDAWKVALVALVILLALGGSAAALVISTSKDSSGSDASASADSGSEYDTSTTDEYTDTTTDYTDDTTTDYTDETTTAETTSDAYPTDTSAYGADGPAPGSGDDAAIATAAQEVIAAHHDDLSSADFDDAWQEFSPRYRTNKLGDANDRGESYGATGALTTAPSPWRDDMNNEFPGVVDTSGISVEVVKTTGDDDALVRVTGMTYTSPKGATDCPYSGLTWVHYEDGKWWYDPGTNHHPERRNEFGNGSTATELLRGRC